MKNLLSQNNLDLLNEINFSISLIEKEFPQGLSPTKKWVLDAFLDLTKEVNRNLKLLTVCDASYFPSIFDRTNQASDIVRYLSNYYVSILHRVKPQDAVAINFLHWLHAQHSQTKDKEFIIADGDFSIEQNSNNPVNFPILYRLPISSNLRIIHYPLFFHELGHYLFSCHALELKDLIVDFQNIVESEFHIARQSNDAIYQQDLRDKIDTVDTWYSWLEEFFCDAVGLTIGGASYLHTFSHYLRTEGRSAFSKDFNALRLSSHPVTWLRIKYLCLRAKKLGLTSEANSILETWKNIAETHNITHEDYHGFYDDDLQEHLTQTLDDMLIEADPISFSDYHNNDSSPNYIHLVNEAWRNFLNDSIGYFGWEKEMIENLSLIPIEY